MENTNIYANLPKISRKKSKVNFATKTIKTEIAKNYWLYQDILKKHRKSPLDALFVCRLILFGKISRRELQEYLDMEIFDLATEIITDFIKSYRH